MSAAWKDVRQPDEAALRALLAHFNRGTDRAVRENRSRPARDGIKDGVVRSMNYQDDQ